MPAGTYHYNSVALACIIFSIAALMALLAVLPVFHGEQRKSLIWWTTATAAVTFSNTFYLFARALPEDLRVILPFAIGVPGYIAFAYAIDSANDSKRHHPVSLFVGLVSVPAVWFLIGTPWSTVVISVLVGFWFALAALAGLGGALRGARGVLVAAFTIGAVIMALRALMYATGTVPPVFGFTRLLMLALTGAIAPIGSLAFLLFLNERLQEQLKHIANVDALTGVASRRALMQQLELRAAQAQKSTRSLGLLMIDIDHFKLVNDTHGHIAGDVILRRVAATLRAMAPAGAMVGRTGGEEFGLIAEVHADEELLLHAERIRKAVETEVAPVTVSVGVARQRLAESPHQLFKRADDALYQAKRDGRNRVARSQVDAHQGAQVTARLP